jgi:hypothetical protein
MGNDEWNKVTTAFVITEIYGKHDSGGRITECPKCFKTNWVHSSLSGMGWDDTFQEQIKVAGKTELERRELQALRDWGAGICWNCKNLWSGSVKTNAYRHCKAGLGGPVKTCTAFEALRKN